MMEIKSSAFQEALYMNLKKLKPLKKEPHSVIGSTSIGASIVGGVCTPGGSLSREAQLTHNLLYMQKLMLKESWN